MWRHFVDQREIVALQLAMSRFDAPSRDASAATRAVSHSIDAVIGKAYKATTTFNDGVWWLILERPDDVIAGYRVTVTDAMGGGGRKEFAQAGTKIIVRFPVDFEVFGLAGTKQPWGRYRVRWDVFERGEDWMTCQYGGSIESEFDWKPLPAPQEVDELTWKIVGGPHETGDPRRPGADVVGWTSKIERDNERRSITILLSRTAYHATGHASDDLAEARASLGRNYVEAVLNREVPPRYRTADTAHTLPDTLIDEPS